MTRAACVSTALLILVGACSPDVFGASRRGDLTAQLRALAGTWEPVSAENNGFWATRSDLDGIIWIRRANGRWTMRRGGKDLVEWTVKAIDARKSPKTIDLEVSAGAYKGVVYLGIYELDGDTMRICFALPDKPERPTEFGADKGTVRALAAFKRLRQ